MLPLFYFNPRNKSWSFDKKEGFLKVTRNNGVYGFVSHTEEFCQFEDQSLVVTQFKNMVFLDQCYWV